MPDYDFHTISPVDFEHLTRDLMQARDGVEFQSFKTGPDGGIDLRYARNGENQIVQCKHFRKSGYSKLLREVRAEAKKLALMRPPPTRYFLSTSVELSDANKRELASALNLSGTSDILGDADLNGLLGRFPEIERAHYKLWLASTPVLEAVLHNAERTKSQFEFRRIRTRVPRFVQTVTYDEAAAQLDRDRILILSGTPGVGKTTIAEFLLYERAAQGFEPVIAREGLHQAEKLYREGVPQVFYYDDFLGATYLGEGGSAFLRNEDRAIADFMEMVAADDTKLLILTTREHILSEAFEESERLRQAATTDYRYIVPVEGYSEAERARILYNHAHFNRLPAAYLTALLRDEFYLSLIQHPKFSPRLMDWLTAPRRLKSVLPRDYCRFALKLLDNPAEIWTFAYEKQISDAARSLLLALHSLEGRASHERLGAAFAGLHGLRATRYGFRRRPGDFLAALRVLGGSFVRIHRNAVEFIDPSVRDLMNTVLHTPDNAIDILSGAVSMTQVGTVWGGVETRDGEHILDEMERDRGRWEAGVLNALRAPTWFEGDTYALTHAPRMGERLVLLMDIAFGADSSRLLSELAVTVERTMEDWRAEPPEFRNALYILQELKGLQFQGAVPESLRRRLRSTLLLESNLAIEPRHILDFLNQEPTEDLAPGELEGLRALTTPWPVKMGDRLRDCRSVSDLNALKHVLSSVETRLSVDLRSLVNAIDTEIEMFGDEAQDTSDFPSESHYGRRQSRPTSITDLFASLRQDDDTSASEG